MLGCTETVFVHLLLAELPLTGKAGFLCQSKRRAAQDFQVGTGVMEKPLKRAGGPSADRSRRTVEPAAPSLAVQSS